MSLQGKVAIVTGASRGIGRAIALRLAKDGAAVVVNYPGSEPQAREVVAAIEKAGGRAVAVRADVSKVSDVVRLFDATFEQFGRLDILVNNAGVRSDAQAHWPRNDPPIVWRAGKPRTGLAGR
jgi:3-oxoacyl-[acyl-carrier protein] reductase